MWLTGVDALHLLEVNERDILRAKDAVELQKIEGPPHDVRLRNFGFDCVQVCFACKKGFGAFGVEDEIAPPWGAVSPTHNERWEADGAGSEDMR